jgi:hypothetical protein
MAFSARYIRAIQSTTSWTNWYGEILLRACERMIFLPMSSQIIYLPVGQPRSAVLKVRFHPRRQQRRRSSRVRAPQPSTTTLFKPNSFTFCACSGPFPTGYRKRQPLPPQSECFLEVSTSSRPEQARTGHRDGGGVHVQ